ncbi:hypothetical protein PF024_00875 [Enterococcus thailandicus]|nr:hypothetical protein [Enterococcus thailandicus]MDA3964069.1 hypothetical protein [Enterococcus thailandicus]
MAFNVPLTALAAIVPAIPEPEVGTAWIDCTALFKSVKISVSDSRMITSRTPSSSA